MIVCGAIRQQQFLGEWFDQVFGSGGRGSGGSVLRLNELTRTVSRIHATPAAPHLWQQILTDLAGDLGARACTLATGAGSGREIFSTSNDPEATISYESYYHRLDFVAAACEKNSVGVVSSGWDLVASNKHTEFHADWQRRFGMTDGFYVRLSASTPASLYISAPPRAEPFETAERNEFVTALIPHIRQALATRHQFGGHGSVLFDATADLIPHAVFVVGRGGRVAQMNTLAQQMALVPDGLSVRSNRVRADSSTSDTQLQAAIARALPDRNTLARTGGILMCSRPSSRRSYVIRVVPLNAEDDPHRARAAVVVINPEHAPNPSRELLRTVFGLTAAEHEVALRVLRGDDTKMIAANLSVSVSTVRTHLQRVFAKTGTHRQVELMRLLMTIAS